MMPLPPRIPRDVPKPAPRVRDGMDREHLATQGAQDARAKAVRVGTKPGTDFFPCSAPERRMTDSPIPALVDFLRDIASSAPSDEDREKCDQAAAALEAQAAEIERLKHYIARMEEARANKPDYEVLWAEQVERAEKAEALWEDRLRALAEAQADLAILLHAHDNGNAVPPLMMREIRARHNQGQGGTP